jgi:proteasome accessory factor PafA2
VGVETEYGVAITGPQDIHPVTASALVVNAYRAEGDLDVAWDYTDEQPDRDARHTPVRAPRRELVLDEYGMSNTVLMNGARLYVDHAHPEYATPECSNARDLIVWDVAGERILEEAGRRVQAALPAGSSIHLHKNNTDGKGAAYGTHENYLVPRSIPFGLMTRHLLPMFVSRLALTGAGRIGSEHDPGLSFQLSQRADFFEVEVGLETTVKRPLMNTRDEPHADPERFRRLHVINGDANLCEVAGLVKVGAMMLVLDAIACDGLDGPLELVDPVAAFRTLSHDVELTATVGLTDGRRLGALDLQEHYLERCHAMVARDGHRGSSELVLARWEELLVAARSDLAALVGRVDWVTKLQLLEAFRARHGLPMTHERVRMVDLQYHDVRRDKGLYHRLVAAGRVERVVTEAEVLAAVQRPPEDTRAWFRGECIRRFPAAIVAAGWDSLVLDTGGGSLARLPMDDPALGTRALTEGALQQAADVEDLLARLGVDVQLPGQLA